MGGEMRRRPRFFDFTRGSGVCFLKEEAKEAKEEEGEGGEGEGEGSGWDGEGESAPESEPEVTKASSSMTGRESLKGREASEEDRRVFTGASRGEVAGD